MDIIVTWGRVFDLVSYFVKDLTIAYNWVPLAFS